MVVVPGRKAASCLQVLPMGDPACPEPLSAPLLPTQLSPAILRYLEGLWLLPARETTCLSFDRSSLPQLPKCRPWWEGLLKQKPHSVGCAGEMTLMVLACGFGHARVPASFASGLDLVVCTPSASCTTPWHLRHSWVLAGITEDLGGLL